MVLKHKFLLFVALAASALICSCGCKDNQKTAEPVEQEEADNAFSAEALADLVEYERQKEGEGTEYNPWLTYGLKEMVDMDAAEDEDFEYQDADEADAEAEEEADATEEAIPDATDDYVGDPVVYYLGYHVDFNAAKADITAFTKSEDDGVGVIDRFDDNGSRIDIIVFDKKIYDDFVQKSKDPVRYQPLDDNTYLSKDSLGRDVSVSFAGPSNGGYLFSIQAK